MCIIEGNGIVFSLKTFRSIPMLKLNETANPGLSYI